MVQASLPLSSVRLPLRFVTSFEYEAESWHLAGDELNPTDRQGLQTSEGMITSLLLSDRGRNTLTGLIPNTDGTVNMISEVHIKVLFGNNATFVF